MSLRKLVVMPIFCLLPAALLAQEALLDTLTCSFPAKGEKVQMEVLREIESTAKQVGDGTFVVAGAITGEGFSIANVYVTGAFGVLMVSGEVRGDPAALLDFVRARNQELLPVVPGQAGVLSAHEGGKRGLMMFKGTADPVPKIDLHSEKVSYICTYLGAGPQ